MEKNLDKESLLEIADWLDVSDNLLKDYANLLKSLQEYRDTGKTNLDVYEKTGRMAELIEEAVSGSEMQDDIREWAELFGEQ